MNQIIDERYNEKKSNYYGHVRPEILRLVLNKVNRVLDVGCSDGSFAKQLLDNDLCNEVHGIEPFKDAFLKAQDKLNFVFNSRVEDVISKLEDNYYDIIFFNDVLEHLIDPEQVLKEFKSKLTHDGIIITSVPNVRNLGNLYNLIIKRDWEYVESGILDSTHLRFFTLKSFERTVRNAGYNVIFIGGNEENKISFKGLKFILNLFFISFFKDTRYLQILSVISPKS